MGWGSDATLKYITPMKRIVSRLSIAATLVAGAVGAPPVSRPAAAQDAVPFTVRWEPEHPKQGSFVFIVVADRDTTGRKVASAVGGSVAGQELHFERDRNGAFRALAAVPVNAQETLPVQVAWETPRDTVHRLVRMPVVSGDFPSERLSVDPRFSTPPDSALQVRIRRENALSRQVSIDSHSTPRLWSGEWVRPRPGRVTSEFGTGRVFNGELQSRHMGTDLDGDRGDPIRAGNRGRVALVGDFYYSGNVVYLDHGAGLITIYMHMSKVEVEQGQIVEAGQVIGLVGATGRVTGPHLHWTGRYGRVSVDALTLFDLDPTAFGPPPPAVAEPAQSR
jgi:murein DD-endopeptidase MepM/ murein hydrolase activator NlpD